MTVIEKLFGAVLISGAFFMAVGAAINALAKHPNWFGVSIAVSSCITGCFIIASVARDRL